ncbi:MAG: hypothetical protein QOI27_1737 [Gaiellaceae bacterium]|jgi:hypothetical protein|nr:hypothetical protein [Gaiellaceae bacterium]
MRVRVAASVVFALAGAVVLYVSLQARAADRRNQALQTAALVGGAVVSPRSPADAYLAALAAFRADQNRPAETAAGARAATIAVVQQSIGSALAAGQPAAQRSQLENLAGVLERELAGLGGAEARAHNGAAAHWLQRAVLDDDTNADAKFNLELLIARDPSSGRKQPQPPTGKSENQSKPKHQHGSPKPQKLGNGF